MLIANELRYLLRQPLTLVAWPVLAIFAYVLSSGLSVDNANYLVKVAMKLIGLVMMTLPIYIAVVAPIAFQRDTHSNMTELVNVTATSSFRRWWARYLGFLMLVTSQFGLAFLIVIATSIYEAPVEVSEMRNSDFLLLGGYFISLIWLPTLLFFLALSLMLTRAALITHYLIFMLLFLAFMVASSLTGSPILAGSKESSEGFYLTMLWLDPYGFTAMIDGFTVGATPLSAALVINRVVYAITAVLLARFAIKQLAQCALPSLKAKQAKPATMPIAAIHSPRVHAPLWHLFMSHCKQILAAKSTRIILIVWPILIAFEMIAAIDYVEPFSIMQATSLNAINRVISDIVPVFSVLILLIWTWQLVSTDRRHNMHELIAATKVKNSDLILAHVFASWFMIWILMGLLFVGGSAAEAFAGSLWQPQVYLTQLSAVALSLMLLASVFISIQHIVRNKLVIGVMLFVLLVFKFTPVATTLGLTHTLWSIAGSPLQPADHFWGLSASTSVFWPYMTVWIGFSVGLLGLALALSHRNTFLDRLKLVQIKQRLINKSVSRFGIATIVLGFGIATCSGILLHQGLVKERPLTFSQQREAWKINYENEFNDWASRAQPSISNVASIVDFYPQQQTVDFKLTLTLTNHTSQAISQVLMGRYGNASPLDFRLSNPSLGRFQTVSLGQSVLHLSAPLQPAESLSIETQFSYSQPQLWPAGLHTIVKPQFSYIRGLKLMPTVGFQPHWQLRDNVLRTSYGLPKLDQPLPSELVSEQPSALPPVRPSEKSTPATTSSERGTTWPAYAHWVHFQTTISTDLDHHAVGNGALLRSWEKNNRRYFSYATRNKIRPIASWFSVPYRPLSLQVGNGITLNVFAPDKTHDGRTANISENKSLNLKAMADTMAWFEQYVGAYPNQQLNLFASPGLRTTGYALPNNMLISFRHGFLAKPVTHSQHANAQIQFDQRYRRAVHETAHQWFGHGLGNGVLHDGAFLIESLAKYVELVMIQTQYGDDAMQALVNYEIRRYALAERHYYDQNMGLVDARAPHQNYSGATIAFSRLRALVGDGPIIKTLKTLWQNHRYPNRPATSMDFVYLLKNNVSLEHKNAIDELFLKHIKASSLINEEGR